MWRHYLFHVTFLHPVVMQFRKVEWTYTIGLTLFNGQNTRYGFCCTVFVVRTLCIFMHKIIIWILNMFNIYFVLCGTMLRYICLQFWIHTQYDMSYETKIVHKTISCIFTLNDCTHFHVMRIYWPVHIGTYISVVCRNFSLKNSKENWTLQK